MDWDQRRSQANLHHFWECLPWGWLGREGKRSPGSRTTQPSARVEAVVDGHGRRAGKVSLVICPAGSVRGTRSAVRMVDLVLLGSSRVPHAFALTGCRWINPWRRNKSCWFEMTPTIIWSQKLWTVDTLRIWVASRSICGGEVSLADPRRVPA